MMVGASSQVFQQLGGCNAVIYYATVLFENSIGLETRLSLILGGVLSVIYAISACTSFLFVERAGRRKMFLIGSAGQMVAMIITFACLIPGTPETAKGAAVGLFLYIVFFGSCWLPLPWLYPAELNPLRVRTKANAVSTMANWCVCFKPFSHLLFPLFRVPPFLLSAPSLLLEADSSLHPSPGSSTSSLSRSPRS